MDENKVDVTETEQKNFFVRTKNKIVSKAKSFSKFVEENPSILLPMVSLAGSLVFNGLRMLAGGNDRNEKCMVEDDVTGEHLVTKHPLTNAEILELADRMIDGQPKGSALDDMGLLRNEKRRK